MTASTYSEINYDDSISINAPAVLKGWGIVSPTYYVVGRKTDGCITQWTLCDAMSKSEQTVEFSDEDFRDDKISFNSVISKIIKMCGFTAVAGITYIASELYFERGQAVGNSGHSLLDSMASAMLGYWFANGTTLDFVPFGQYHSIAHSEKYSKIIPCGTKHFSRVMMTDGEAAYTSGTGSARETIISESQYASEETARAAYENMLGDKDKGEFSYKAWQCEKGIANDWIFLGAIQFGSSILYCNNVTMLPGAGGMFFTASCNAVQEDEATYLSEMERNLKSRISLGKVNGNVAIDRKGMYFFENGYKEKQREDSSAKVKYGFSVGENGVTEYEGALVSSVVPDKAEFSGSTAVVSYGNKKYQYTITEDPDGNISGLKKEEVQQ